MTAGEALARSFALAGPVDVVVEMGVGELRVVASDRADAVVEVRPGDPAKAADVAAAAGAQAELAGGVLTVRTPRRWRHYTPLPYRPEWVRVTVHVPTGSRLRASAIMAALHLEGTVAACRFHTSMGNVLLEDAGTLDVRTGGGDVTAGAVAGTAVVRTGTGVVRLDAVGAGSRVHTGNGDVLIGDAGDGAKVTSSNGGLVVDRARGSLTARTSNGRVSVGEVARGALDVRTAAGPIDVAVRDGVAAELDVHTHGAIRSTLAPITAPGATDDAVRIAARSSFGDVLVRRVSDTA